MKTPEFQKLLETSWNPVVNRALQLVFESDIVRDNMKPHIAYDGYCPLVDGGGEIWVGLTGQKMIENEWFMTTVGKDAFASHEEGEDEDDFDNGEVFCWLKVRCLVRGVDTPSEWEAEFDSYICTDSYGRDSISWLRYMGGKPNQTIGDFCEMVHSSDPQLADEVSAKEFLRAIAIKQVRYLIDLRDAKDPAA